MKTDMTGRALGLLLLVVIAAPASAGPSSSSVLQSLPAEAQNRIERVRASCREAGEKTTAGDEGLTTFTVSDAQAVLVDELEFCAGGQCLHGINCATGSTHQVVIYVRSGSACRKALSNYVSGPIFLSLEYGTWKFKLMVVHVFAGDKGCPDRGKLRETCAAVLRWDGASFNYKLL